MTVPIPALIVFLVVYTALVIALDRKVFAKDRDRAVPVNKIPDRIPDFSDNEKEVLAFYQKEWKIIIETQMHFNDLIIRFRSIVLTAFVTLTGASVALAKASSIDNNQLSIIFWMLSALWATAFVMDFFYYHRLLLGSVAQAMKFDDSTLGKSLGLFGLTTCISRVVHPPTSRFMVLAFYGIPAMAIAFIIYHFWSG